MLRPCDSTRNDQALRLRWLHFFVSFLKKYTRAQFPVEHTVVQYDWVVSVPVHIVLYVKLPYFSLYSVSRWTASIQGIEVKFASPQREIITNRMKCPKGISLGHDWFKTISIFLSFFFFAKDAASQERIEISLIFASCHSSERYLCVTSSNKKVSCRAEREANFISCCVHAS